MNDRHFQEIYRTYYQCIYNYIYGRILRREAAEDVTAEVFLSAWKKLGNFDTAKGSMTTWLYAIAANKTTDYLKQAHLKHEVCLAALPETTEKKAAGESADPMNRLVLRVLNRLTEEERRFLMLRYEIGLTNDEIANMACVSPNAISARFYRLLKKCRKLLEEDF